MAELSPLWASSEAVENLSRERSEPKWLRDFRIKSFELFRNLPVEQSSLYTKYGELTGVDLRELSPLTEPKPIEKAAKLPQTKAREGITLLQRDFQIYEPVLPEELVNIGVIFEDIGRAIERDPEFFRPYFVEKAILPEEDKFAAMNYAFFTSGVFLYVPKGVEIRTPFRSVKAVDTPGIGLFSHNIIVADSGSKLTFLDEGYSKEGLRAEKQSLYSSVLEIYLRDGAEVDFGGLQNFSPSVISLRNTRSIGSRDSKVSWAIGYLGGGFTRSRLDSVLNGDGSTAQDLELVFGNETQRFDMTSNLIHRGTHTGGQMRAKGVLRDRARAIFKGLIRIAKLAKNANSYLAEHAMLLSREARSDAIPGLEIENNEVKATHSASVAQINEEQIFYLQSRGLAEDDAKKLIVTGFFEPLIQQMSLREIRQRIRIMLEVKWRGLRGPDALEPEFIEMVKQQEGPREAAAKDIFEGHYKYR